MGVGLIRDRILKGIPGICQCGRAATLGDAGIHRL